MDPHFQLSPATSILYFGVNEMRWDGETERMAVHEKSWQHVLKKKVAAVKWNDQRFYRPKDSHSAVIPSSRPPPDFTLCLGPWMVSGANRKEGVDEQTSSKRAGEREK